VVNRPDPPSFFHGRFLHSEAGSSAAGVGGCPPESGLSGSMVFQRLKSAETLKVSNPVARSLSNFFRLAHSAASRGSPYRSPSSWSFSQSAHSPACRGSGAMCKTFRVRVLATYQYSSVIKAVWATAIESPFKFRCKVELLRIVHRILAL
jgi:hypothetical protein